jgi:WD repeat-containing protein 61
MAKLTVQKLRTLEGHRDAVYALTNNEDSSKYYSSGGDGMVVEWEAGKTDGELLVNVPNSVYALACSNGFLAIGHNYDGIHWVDIASKKEIKNIHLGDAAIFDIRIKGGLIYVAMGSGELVVIDVADFSIKFRKHFSTQRIRKVFFYEDLIFLASSDNQIKILNKSFELVKQWDAHMNTVTGFVVCDNRLISVGRDARIKFWAIDDQYSLYHEIPGHLYAINDISLSPNKKYFATCSIDKTIKVWDTKQMRLLKVIDKQRSAGHGTSINKIFWANDRQIVSSSDDRTLSVWEIEELTTTNK